MSGWVGYKSTKRQYRMLIVFTIIKRILNKNTHSKRKRGTSGDKKKMARLFCSLRVEIVGGRSYGYRSNKMKARNLESFFSPLSAPPLAFSIFLLTRAFS